MDGVTLPLGCRMDVQIFPSLSFLPWVILSSGLSPFCPLKIKDNLFSTWKSVDVQPAPWMLQCSAALLPQFPLTYKDILLPTQDSLDIIYLRSENPWRIPVGNTIKSPWWLF